MKQKIFLINGIRTNYQEALAMRDAVIELIVRPVELVHNETDGVFRDLFESFMGRRVKPSRAAHAFSKRIKAALLDDKHDEVIIISHSQGGIITSNAIRLLHGPFYHLRPRIKVICFGSANSREPGNCYWEYFYNRGVVIKLSFQWARDDLSWGPLFKRDGWGHNFIKDYMKTYDEFSGPCQSLFRSMISSRKQTGNLQADMREPI